MVNIGGRIRQRLDELGMAPIDLVVKIGMTENGRYRISPARLSNYMCNCRMPSLSVLELLARNLDVDLNYFASGPFEKAGA